MTVNAGYLIGTVKKGAGPVTDTEESFDLCSSDPILNKAQREEQSLHYILKFSPYILKISQWKQEHNLGSYPAKSYAV